MTSLSIGKKILLALVAISVLTAAMIAISNANVTGSIISQAEERELSAYNKQLMAMLDKQAETAVALASQIANIPDVQKAMFDQDRERLSEMFVPSFSLMREQFDVRQFQFHLPPATSFLRVHRPEKFGDDLSSFRHAVVEANTSRQNKSGLEVGVAGLGMRGIATVSHQGQHQGTVEIGLSFGQPFFNSFKEKTGADVALVTTNSGKRQLFASTFGEGAIDPSSDEITRGISGAFVDEGFTDGDKSYARMIAPVADFSGKTIGALVIAIDREYFVKQKQSAMQRTLIIVLLSLGVVLVLSYFINKSIASPIVTMTHVMQNMADGSLDIDVPARGRKDEIGAMAETVEIFRQAGIEKIELEKAAEQARLKEAEEKEARQQAAQAAERKAAEEKVRRAEEAEKQRLLDRKAMADNFEAHIGEIIRKVSGSSAIMATTAKNMSEVATETSHKATEALGETRTAGENVQSVASAAEELYASVQEVSSQLAQANGVSNNAVEQSRMAGANVVRLKETGEKITDVIKLINDIADQTNLLALNATIEAARAGEAGKGFTVVASEVKALAAQTARAIDEISGQISDMQAVTDETVEAVNLIGKTIEEINSISSAIAGAAEEQAAATQEISQSTQRTASGTDAVVANIETVTGLSHDNGRSAEDVLAASNDLAAQAQQLQQEVDKFLDDIRKG
ncbi:methyl-accepting chemotaxis protein [Kordiimonas sediminis]|uniref:Methyl-accepting chemotaxis protein n=1 Tax=Kordiimonas sediminis TaxID=1735581 RepID=A0A919ASH8_9PROT|nr:cache domain-containing protein [Kordiimonas sediminis]GHF22831.1 methyl-accepting chemotaxis protein [Kordiimonas sediminis]